MGVGDEIVAMREACEQMQPYQRTDCPNDGWPLEMDENGVLHCPFDGWRA